MRRTGLILAVLTLTANLPLSARAATCTPATCNVITITQVGAPANTYTFTVPDTASPVAPDTDGTFFFDLKNIAVTGPLGYSSANDTVYFYPSATYPGNDGTGTYFGGLWDPSLVNAAQPGSNPSGFYVADAVFFNGSVVSPSFNLSSLTTTGPLVNYWGAGTYNYSITAFAAPAAATPELSSLTLLGTGALGLVATWRRRRLA